MRAPGNSINLSHPHQHRLPGPPYPPHREQFGLREGLAAPRLDDSHAGFEAVAAGGGEEVQARLRDDDRASAARMPAALAAAARIRAAVVEIVLILLSFPPRNKPVRRTL